VITTATVAYGVSCRARASRYGRVRPIRPSGAGSALVPPSALRGRRAARRGWREYTSGAQRMQRRFAPPARCFWRAREARPSKRRSIAWKAETFRRVMRIRGTRNDRNGSQTTLTTQSKARRIRSDV
jgi:hypothetical protein